MVGFRSRLAFSMKDTEGRASGVLSVDERSPGRDEGSAGRLNRRIRALDACLAGPAGAPRKRHRHMTRPAEQAIVLEAALAAAVGHRHDVVRLPSGPRDAPGFACGTIAGGRFGPGPLTVRFHHIEAAQPAGALVALLYLLTHVPGAAADFPLVHARVATKRAPRRLYRRSTPAADGLARFRAIGLPPLSGRDNAGAAGAHGREYRAFSLQSSAFPPSPRRREAGDAGSR